MLVKTKREKNNCKRTPRKTTLTFSHMLPLPATESWKSLAGSRKAINGRRIGKRTLFGKLRAYMFINHAIDLENGKAVYGRRIAHQYTLANQHDHACFMVEVAHCSLLMKSIVVAKRRSCMT